MLPANSEHFTPRKNRKRGYASSCRKCVNSLNREKSKERKEEKYREITEKKCTSCLKVKPISEFRKRSDRQFGVFSHCIECLKKEMKEYRDNNKDKIKEKREQNKDEINAKNRKYYKENKEKILFKCKEYRNNNIDTVRERGRNNYYNNKEKYALSSRRKEVLIKKVTVDFGELSDFIISEIYSLRDLRTTHTKIKWHVDHIVPLKSKLVSGLHCGFNLRLLPAYENIGKGNRYWDDMPEYRENDLIELKVI